MGAGRTGKGMRRGGTVAIGNIARRSAGRSSVIVRLLRETGRVGLTSWGLTINLHVCNLVGGRLDTYIKAFFLLISGTLLKVQTSENT